jgi:DnaJ-domain-containing protein 1
MIEELRRQKSCNDRFLELDGRSYHQNLDKLSHQLDTLSSPSIWKNVRSVWSSSYNDNKTYKRLCNELLRKVEGRFKQASVALKARDLVSVQESIEFLELVHQKADKHVQIVGSILQNLRNDCIAAFSKLCDEAKQILSSDNCIPFKEIFIDYRGYIIHIPCVLQSSNGRKGFALINQMLHESLEKAVLVLRELAKAEILESSRLKAHVQYSRSWGNFLADHLTLLHEEVNSLNAEIKSDKWLANICTVCWEIFNFGRDLSKLKYCAVLGVLPSASQKDINKAFRSMAKQSHPDKTKASDGADFRKTKEAQEELLKMSHFTAESREQPFDRILLGVGKAMRDHAKSFMNDQRYDMMEKMLFELNNIATLDDLVAPKLNSDKIKSSLYEIVEGIVKQSRVDVESNWSARNYKDLNMNISTLKNMEQHFKAYPQIFPKSWDTGIRSTIEAEIESLGQKASACLQSRAIAEEKQGDFRRCFIQMGFVLIELPSFKNFTKSVMSCVLETCLDSGWGYAYLFELGLSLQKGDDASSEDESRVAQMIVTEFSHFKEVLVMV